MRHSVPLCLRLLCLRTECSVPACSGAHALAGGGLRLACGFVFSHFQISVKLSELCTVSAMLSRCADYLLWNGISAYRLTFSPRGGLIALGLGFLGSKSRDVAGTR